MNILVVEDDAELARLLVQGLKEEAHQVDTRRKLVARCVSTEEPLMSATGL